MKYPQPNASNPCICTSYASRVFKLWSILVLTTLVSLQAGLSMLSVCGCDMASSPGIAASAQAATAPEAGTDAATSCCIGQRGPETPADQDRDQDRPCDDCPRLCCAVLKVVATPAATVRAIAPATVTHLGVQRSAGHRLPPHLDLLRRPPKSPTSC